MVSELTGDDVILCQITSQNISDNYAIPLLRIDFADGKLNRDSNIRPNRLFTADSKIVHYRLGSITPDKMQAVVDKIVEIVNQ